MGGHHLQRIVDVGEVRPLIWCIKCTGWVSENRSGKRLRDVCKPGDSKSSCQLRMLEQEFRPGRKWTWQERVNLCAWEASAEHRE